MLKILSAPHNVLTSPAKPIEKIDKKLKELVFEMEEVLIAQVDPQGVGLAAPQVGVGLQLFIIKPDLDEETEVFINPKILKLEKLPRIKNQESRIKKTKSSKLEGCLSIPKIWAHVKRPQKVYLEYTNLVGETKKEWFTGLKAIIVQHEVDHLIGVLFTQRAIEQNTQLYEEQDGEFVKIGS